MPTSPSPSLNHASAPVNTFTADYPNLFGDHGVHRCPDEALESSFGPFAYADFLMAIVRRLESKVGQPPVSPLAGRRADIAGLLLDEPALNRRVPRLSLAIECLEAMVESTDGTGGKAAAILAASMSPASLPFDRAWTLITQVLRSKRRHPWQLLRQTDEDYPNFSHRDIVNTSMRNALTLCTGLAPAQLRALQDASATTESAVWLRLGLPTGVTIESLADSATFLKATGLNRKRLRQLLAVNGVARDGDTGAHTSVTVSKEGHPAGQPGSSAFGASFINDGQSPALRLIAGGAAGKATRIENLSVGHLQRIDSMLRLHVNTGLSFAALDRLLQAIFGAQGRDTDRRIDVHALRALGLYGHLRDSRRVTLDAYAAVLHEISPYATGRDTSYYDRLFHSGAGRSDLAGTEPPLTMDNGAFAGTGSDPTMQRLCAGLGVGSGTLSTLLAWVLEAQELAAPARNLSLISACHRLAVLPRWLGLDERKGVALLRLLKLTQPELFGQLAGIPELSKVDTTATAGTDDATTPNAADKPDIVDAIVTLMNVSDWLRRHRLDAMSLSNALSTEGGPKLDMSQLVPNGSAQREALAVTDERLRDAFLEMPFANEAIREPAGVLSSLIERTGLFKDAVFDMDATMLDAEIGSALDAARDKTAGNLAATSREFGRTTKRVGDRLRESLEGQRALAEQTLVALLPDIADPAMRANLAEWSGASPKAILGLLGSDKAPPDDAGPWLDALRRRSRLVSLLAVDNATLTALRNHREWFDLDQSDVQNPGLIVVHRLTDWNRTVRDIAARSAIDAETASENLLAYLGSSGHTGRSDPLTRLANLLHVEKTVVTSVVATLPGTTPGTSLTTASHIAWLLRLQALADRTTTSIEALLALARLDPDSSPADMEAAGQLLLATCQPSERDLIVGMHNEAWRDAMVAWLLARASDTDGHKFAGRDELSAWLLTDVDVGSEPETTRLAATLDSLQLYIHRLLSGLEKHVNENADIKEERKEWSAYRSRYVDWRQFRERRAYPENHIDPARRQRKTSAFLDLEAQLAQGQARPADIDTTLLKYLADFERTSNIQVLSAYHDGNDPTGDQLHLVGRSNIEPYEYFWQSARMDIKAADGHTGMLAWSGWTKIDLPINGELTRTKIPKPIKSAKDPIAQLRKDTTAADTDEETARATRIALAVARDDEDDSRDAIETIRPLTIDGRKYIVWVERDSSAIVFDNETAASEYYALRVCYSYLDTNDNWSASNTLLVLDGRAANGTRAKPAASAVPDKLFKRSYMPGLIVMENRKGRRETEPYLVVMTFDSEGVRPTDPKEGMTWESGKNYFLAVRDLLLIDEKRLDGTLATNTLENRLVNNWFNLYRDPRVVQHPYIGAKYVLKLPEATTVTSEVQETRLASLREKMFMSGPDSVHLAAELTGDGGEIEITGSFDGGWIAKSTSKREIKTVDDIARVCIDHVIELHVYELSAEKKNKSLGFIQYSLRAIVDADSWTSNKIVFDEIAVKSKQLDDKELQLIVYSAASNGSKEGISYKANKALGLFEMTFPNLDLKTKSMSVKATLPELLRNREFGILRDRPVGRSTYVDTKDKGGSTIGVTLEPKPLDTDIQAGRTIPVTAKLIRVGNTESSGSKTSDRTLLPDLRSKDTDMREEFGQEGELEALYTLATSSTVADRAALVAWLPLLTDTWRIPAQDYYEALRNEGLEYGMSDGSALSGSLPFLQAMHATNREALREVFVRCVADSLGTTLDTQTRDKVPAALRTKLVWFSARENESYRALLGRLAKCVGGNNAEVIIKTEELDANARGTKRITARIPVDADETDYTFRLILSTDDPTTRTDGEVHEWIRLTAPYTLANITEANTALPDDRVPTARIRRNSAQAQYLDLDESGLPPIRLNTLFGKQLVARATRSVDAAISIEAQTLPEPAMRAGGSGGFVDFRGANGLYFWELFFYVPWLVAWSLREKGHYADAWQWCSRYLFDPYRGRTTETTAPVPFWNCLPLIYPLDGARNSGEAPELAGYANAIFFRKALHAFLVDLWRMEGDDHFRRMNPDSMREANLCYQKALQLIGTLQEPAEARPWTPTALGSRKAAFVQPVNRSLRDRRTLLLARLENLRHGRTIDGVLVPYLGYGDEDAESSGNGGRRGSTGGLRALSLSTLPAYRFHDVIAMALAAVERLTDLGRYLFRIYEHEADNALDVERQKNLLALADFDISLRRKAVETTKRERNTLHLGKQAIETRISYYAGQLASPRSGLEIAASTLSVASSAFLYARYAPIAMTAGLKSIPNMWGMAFGGQKIEGVSEAVDNAFEVTAEATRLLAEDLRTEAGYERRNEEWAHDKAQAEHDLRIVTSQLEEQTSRAASAAIELEEAIKRREYLRGEFEVQTTGFAIASTYTWMLGRLGELFASTYQSVFSLCLDAEASYRYETGDFDSRHIRLDAWSGVRRGMFAGEALQNDLQVLQGAYLRRHVRRLDIHRTVSLRALLGDDLTNQLKSGVLRFSLDAKLFDVDFPGHYLRQIRHLAVALIPTTGAKTLRADSEIRAVLTQSSSTLLYRPDPEGVEWLYDPEKGRAVAIVRDLRGGQQTVLSRATPRPAADPVETIVLRTEYADGRYGSFEGTGAISSWTLTFPGDRTDFNAFRREIGDIEIRLDYSAAWGGAELEEKVASLLSASPATSTGRVKPTGKPGTDPGETIPPANIPPGTPIYPTPTVREATANNAIDRRDTPNGATIAVVPWAYIRKGQAIWLRCLGTKADGSNHDLDMRLPPLGLTEDEVTKGLTAVIPLNYLDELGDHARLRIVLRVGLSGSANEARATAFPEVALDLPRGSGLRVLMDEVNSLRSLPDPALPCDYGYVATSAEVGPLSLSLNGTTNILHVRGVDTSGKEQTIHCRASRRVWHADATAADHAWDSAVAADGRDHQNSTQLLVVVRGKDNPDLPFGTYRGHTTLQLMGWQVPRVMESILLDLDVTHQAEAPVAPTTTPTTPSQPETPKPESESKSGFAAPGIEYKDGIVTVIVPGNAGFKPDDNVYVEFRQEGTDVYPCVSTYLSVTQDGLRYSVPSDTWKSATGSLPGKYLTFSYTVRSNAVNSHERVETKSAWLRIKLTPLEQQPDVMIPVLA